MEKNNGEELPSTYGTPFDMTQDPEGHYHSVDHHGIDHDWGTDPFDDERQVAQTAASSEPLRESAVVDEQEN